MTKPIEILLLEDNPGDVCLTREALRDTRVANHLSVVADGEEALAFLKRHGPHEDALRPDLIILDLNLPRKSGREVLREIKADPHLKRIPVVVLTTSSAEADLRDCYNLSANAYVVKPIDLDQFMDVFKAIETFWLSTVWLPPA